ncbi:MAG: glycoside hydrolase family 2 TIM barrel-domain containing protein [Opitutaceae bacterium]|nr:glycoside hydrolase family 2 TIM barrel-domain containing protein [Opitutaceae bacterium]
MLSQFLSSVVRLVLVGFVGLVAGGAHSGAETPSAAPNVRLSFDKDWRFSRSGNLAAVRTDYDDSGWRRIDVPHDWSIEEPVSEANPSGIEGGFFVAGEGWYRKSFALPEAWTGRRITLRFDGVFMNTDVWVNGRHAGHHTSGYSAFIIDVTPHLSTTGTNTVTVRVANDNPSASRWFTGSGIYRHVWLEAEGPVTVPFGGVYVRSTLEKDGTARLAVQTVLRNSGGGKQEVITLWKIIDPQGKVVAEETRKDSLYGEAQLDGVFSVPQPLLWSIEAPNLYRIETTLTVGGVLAYRGEEHFGIRTAVFDPEQGFLLNGVKVPLKGVCIHHDVGGLGAAVPDGAWLRQLQLLKQLGCNAIRLSHNPHSPVLLDLCDRLGFLVINEMFDKWSGRLSHYNTTETFVREGEEDLRWFVLRDRNRPSVVLWTVGNEVDEQWKEEGIATFERLQAVVKALDPSREVSVAMHPGEQGTGPYSLLTPHTRVVNYNYRTTDFPEWKEQLPGRAFVASETKVYQEGHVKRYADIDFSENSWFFIERNPFIAGQFIWAGFDYLGESMGWPRKGLTNCVFLTNGFLKPYGEFTRSIYSDTLMVAVTYVDEARAAEMDAFEHWQKLWFGPPLKADWNPAKANGEPVKVVVFSTAEKVELFLNGRSLGQKLPKELPGRVAQWTVPFEPGELRAVGTRAGQTVEDRIVTAGEPKRLGLREESDLPGTRHTGVAALVISAEDVAGTVVPLAEPTVRVTAGPGGRILGIDNGDLTYHGLYTANEVELRDGKALVWVVVPETGSVRYEVTGVGLESGSLTLER